MESTHFALTKTFYWLLTYAFSCFCLQRLCQRSLRFDPGPIAYVPIVNFFYFMDLARMSYFTVLLFMAPLIGPIAYIYMWSQICIYSDRSPWLALALLLPGGALLLPAYLAFKAD